MRPRTLKMLDLQGQNRKKRRLSIKLLLKRRTMPRWSQKPLLSLRVA